MKDRQSFFHEFIATVDQYDALEDTVKRAQAECFAKQERIKKRMVAAGYSEKDAQYELERAYEYRGYGSRAVA